MMGFKMWRISARIKDKIKRDFTEYGNMIKNIENTFNRQND